MAYTKGELIQRFQQVLRESDLVDYVSSLQIWFIFRGSMLLGGA